MSSTLATVGILSIGEMGQGIAKLLLAHNYRVVTNVTGRSEDTQARARESQIETFSSDVELIKASDYILSIVPPRDALATAQRVSKAVKDSSGPRETPLYYLELNAISPRSAREIAAIFQDPTSVVLVDGGIIGGPPRHESSTDAVNTVSTPQNLSPTSWTRPSIPTSGPQPLSHSPKSGAHLATTMNSNHIAPTIGSASGLKMCFASTTKGATAIYIQAFTAAHRLGVLPHLRAAMSDFVPANLKAAERGLPGMPPKAYRWVAEMREIAATFEEEAGFEADLFSGVAGVYQTVANETVLGAETTRARKRGRTVEDVAEAVVEGLEAKRKKRE